MSHVFILQATYKGPNKKRNAAQRIKFFQMKNEIKEAAPHITELFDNPPVGEKRETQSKIIENLFKKKGKEWTLDLQNPFFKECKERYM